MAKVQSLHHLRTSSLSLTTKPTSRPALQLSRTHTQPAASVTATTSTAAAAATAAALPHPSVFSTVTAATLNCCWNDLVALRQPHSSPRFNGGRLCSRNSSCSNGRRCGCSSAGDAAAASGSVASSPKSVDGGCLYPVVDLMAKASALEAAVYPK